MSKICTLRDFNGQLIISDTDKAEASNNFLLIVFTVDDKQLSDYPHCTDALMEMPQFTTEEVRDAILACKSSYSCGPDGCPSKFLKLFSELYIPQLSLFNMSINQHLVPDAWRLVHVVPIFKDIGSKLLVVNYRLISLTNAFSELME